MPGRRESRLKIPAHRRSDRRDVVVLFMVQSFRHPSSPVRQLRFYSADTQGWSQEIWDPDVEHPATGS